MDAPNSSGKIVDADTISIEETKINLMNLVQVVFHFVQDLETWAIMEYWTSYFGLATIVH